MLEKTERAMQYEQMCWMFGHHAPTATNNTRVQPKHRKLTILQTHRYQNQSRHNNLKNPRKNREKKHQQETH